METPIIKETHRGRNPIHLAAWKGHLECVQILVGFTDTPLAVDDVGETPIHEAARRYCAIFGGLHRQTKCSKSLWELSN